MKFSSIAVAMLMLPILAQSATKPAPVPATAPPAAVPAAPLVVPAAIDSALKSLVDSKQIVGVSALVYERGQEAYFGAFGLADRENNKPFARDTVVQIFSMTKPVTGVALMQLYERGKFELDAPLAVYAPEFAKMQVYAGVDANGQPKYEAPKRPITVRDILRHTAGFNGDGAPEAVAALYRQADRAQPQQRAAGRHRQDGHGAAAPINPARSGRTATPSMCRPTWCRRSPAFRSTSI